jgi:two-component system, OmpR family, KDP operon response regulator KdpE
MAEACLGQGGLTIDNKHKRELVARLRALIRRASHFGPEEADVYVFADVMVDFSKTEITRGGEKITVTPKEFRTLEFLAKNAQRVISQDELLNEVWATRTTPARGPWTTTC